MKIEYVIFVKVSYNMKTSDWYYKSYENYPADEEMEAAMLLYGNSHYPAGEIPRIHYARVEKRYILN